MSFPKDRRFLKLVVFAQLLLETCQTVMLTNDIIRYFTLVYTTLDVLSDPGTSWLSIPLLIGMSTYLDDCEAIINSYRSLIEIYHSVPIKQLRPLLRGSIAIASAR